MSNVPINHIILLCHITDIFVITGKNPVYSTECFKCSKSAIKTTCKLQYIQKVTYISIQNAYSAVVFGLCTQSTFNKNVQDANITAYSLASSYC